MFTSTHRRSAGFAAAILGATLALSPVPAASAAPAADTVHELAYDLGPTAVSLPGLGGQAVEQSGMVYAGTASGRRPVVLVLHGGHNPCENEEGYASFGSWPCPDGFTPIPSYAGYATQATELARRGYIVASLSANGINALDRRNSDAGMTARGELVLETLALLRRADAGESIPGLGTALRGRLDLANIGLVGHSRGGEGAVRAALLNATNGSPFGIRSVAAIAPTNVNRYTLPDHPLLLLTGYCDGDLASIPGQHLVDDSVRAFQDGAMRSSVILMGANHNNFNSEWDPFTASTTTDDDWDRGVTADGRSYAEDPTCGYGPDQEHPFAPTRLKNTEQRQIAADYLASFFDLTLRGDASQARYFDGSSARPDSARRLPVWVSAHAPATARLDLNRFDDPAQLPPVSGNGTLAPCSGLTDGASLPACVVSDQQSRYPHWAPTPAAQSTPGLMAGRFAWTDATARLSLPVPGTTNTSRFDSLTLRLAPDPTAEAKGDLRVVVTDTKGRSAEQRVSNHGDTLAPLPGTTFTEVLPKTLLRTAAIPLGAFDGVDTAHLARVELVPATTTGSVFVSDAALVATQTPSTPRPSARPVVSVSDTDIHTGDTATVTVRLSTAAAVPVSAWISTAWFEDEDDFEPTNLPISNGGRVQFAPGEDTATVTVQVPPTATPAGGATVTIPVTLSGASNALTGTNVAELRVHAAEGR